MELKYAPAKGLSHTKWRRGKCYRTREAPLINESDSQLEIFLENVKKKYANQSRAQLTLF